MKVVIPIAVFEDGGSGRIKSNNLDDELYDTWSGSTPYLVGNRVLLFDLDGDKNIYECTVANTGFYPSSNLDKWKSVGWSNKWRAWDQKSSTQSLKPGDAGITFQVDPQELGTYNEDLAINTVVIFNALATTVRVKLTDDAEGVVYDVTQDLVELSGIDDVYGWSFDPIEYREAAVFADIPPYFEGIFDITLSCVGEDWEAETRVGEIIIGQAVDVGVCEMGSTASIADYSRKDVDRDTGEVSVEQRNAAKTAEFRVLVDSDRINYTRRLINRYIASPLAFIGDGADVNLTPGEMVVFGFVRSFSAVRSSKNSSPYNLRVEELSL